MRALLSAIVYFGTFLSIGYVAKRVLDRYLARTGDLRELQAQYRGGGKIDRFLLGTWYKDR
jgi:CRISPR/Cas system-associated protein Csm6